MKLKDSSAGLIAPTADTLFSASQLALLRPGELSLLRQLMRVCLAPLADSPDLAKCWCASTWPGLRDANIARRRFPTQGYPDRVQVQCMRLPALGPLAIHLPAAERSIGGIPQWQKLPDRLCFVIMLQLRHIRVQSSSLC